MLISRPFDPNGPALPRSHDGCACHRHSMEGVSHCVPCCGPSRGARLFLIQPTPTQDADSGLPRHWDQWKASRDLA